MILVWGSPADPAVAAVCAALAERRAPVAMLDDGALPSLRYDLSLGACPEGWLEIGGREVEAGRLSAVYLRPGPQRPDTATTAAALLSMVETIPARVVNRPSAGRQNLSKPLQLASLAAAGFRTPDTLVTADPAAARDFLRRHRKLIYKSISGIRSIVSAIEVGGEGAARLDGIGHGPVQLQQYIAGTDVRVHVVGARWFATAISSREVDYRYSRAGGDPAALEPCGLPPEVGRLAVSSARDMGLLFAGFDLRRTPAGEWYCFEANPSPGFTYYESHAGQPIAGAVADLLTGG